eukprot:7807033-Pyramimonas_sp.AAC.1
MSPLTRPSKELGNWVMGSFSKGVMVGTSFTEITDRNTVATTTDLARGEVRGSGGGQEGANERVRGGVHRRGRRVHHQERQIHRQGRQIHRQGRRVHHHGG